MDYENDSEWRSKWMKRVEHSDKYDSGSKRVKEHARRERRRGSKTQATGRIKGVTE